ncbi:SusC/RagA family TonB-linked outer membrane protein [Chryseobacterium sp. S90]|uniref:SusC/RagA family TonB-linked outer membrane protein n=1 Tax=Chryseobacterium sp. S90 TaxID=3395373 RepID=UPI0039BD35D2
MNVKLRVLTAGVLFFTGQVVFAQKDTTGSKKDKEQKIDEIVVLGYSKTSTKAKSSASSVTIGSETLENRPNISVLNSIQGTAPGIVANSASGSPGSGKFNIIIRGLSSLNGSTDPLYVIDGIITSGSQFRNLNPNDIDTFSILKDAQATAIYGNRAANGVVVITTKGGKFNSKLRISYDALTSFSVLPKTDYNMSSGQQLLQVQKNAGGGKGATMSQNDINNFTTNTDWRDLFSRVGMSQQHTLSVSAGGENISNFVSLGYVDSEGNIRGTDFKRFTLRNNLNGKSSDGKLTFGAIIGLGFSKRNQLDDETNTAINANTVQNPLFGTVLSAPYLPAPTFSNGLGLFNQIGTASGNGNGAYILYDNIMGGIRNQFTETSLTANVSANYKLTSDLSIGNRTGIDYKNYQRQFARAANGYLSLVVAAGQGAKYGGFEQFNTVNDLTFNTTTNITYNHSFGDHTITAAAYLDYIKVNWQSYTQQQNGLDPLVWEFGAGTGYVPFNPATPNIYRPSASALKVTAGTLAYFGTVDYDYQGKYGVSGVIRRDGSYRFPKDNRWETFWSVAARWNIDKENFMEGSGFNLLKLRASLGTTGNQNLFTVANNTNVLTVGPSSYLDYNGPNPTTAPAYQSLPGYYLANLGNKNLKWEEVKQLDLGVDFNYKGLVEGTFDYYQKRTSRLFNSIPVTYVTGQGSLRGNNGVMDNKGVEGSLRVHILRKANTKLSVFGNVGYNSNKIISMEAPDLTGDFVDGIGGPADQWQLYPYLGVNPSNGEQLFLDKNGNVTQTPTAGDRRLTGKSPMPKYTGGFGFNFQHDGFFVDALFSYQKGGYIYDNLYSWVMNPSYAASGLNVSADLLNAWTPNNTNATVPSLSAVNSTLEGSSDRFLFKSDFVRLKNVSVGYTFDKKALGNLPINSIKVFAQAENIYTFTGWKGFDVEPITTYSLNVYPNPKTYSVGVNVDF